MKKKTINKLIIFTGLVSITSFLFLLSLFIPGSDSAILINQILGPEITNENIWAETDLNINRDIQESIYNNTKIVHPRYYQQNNNNQEVMGIYTDLDESKKTGTDYELTYEYDIYEEDDRIRIKSETFNDKNCLKIYNISKSKNNDKFYQIRNIVKTDEFECTYLEEKILDNEQVLRKENKVQYLVENNYIYGQFEVGFTYDDSISVEDLEVLRIAMLLTNNSYSE